MEKKYSKTRIMVAFVVSSMIGFIVLTALTNLAILILPSYQKLALIPFVLIVLYQLYNLNDDLKNHLV